MIQETIELLEEQLERLQKQLGKVEEKIRPYRVFQMNMLKIY